MRWLSLSEVRACTISARSIWFQGRAIPPQINCDVPCVDFGIIPFGFEEVRSVALENTSGATQTVNAKVIKRTDDTYCDIKISPEVLAIPAGALGSFNVILCPSKAQTYLEEVAFGLPGLIEDYFTLPLRGSSKTPHVALEPESSLVLEDVFIHTAATKSFTIRNTSRLSAQFTVTLEVRLYNVEKGVTNLSGLNSSTSSGDTKTGRHSRSEFVGIFLVFATGWRTRQRKGVAIKGIGSSPFGSLRFNNFLPYSAW